MAQIRSPWRLLRPLFLAGAATAAWLTLSSAPAMADTSLGSDSLLGVTSSASSLAAPVTDTVEPLLTAVSPVSLPPESLAPGLLPAEILPADSPAGPLQSVVDAVAGTAYETTTGVVGAVIPELTEAIPLPEPVGQPASDVLPLPLPAALTDLPVIGGSSGQQDPEVPSLPAPLTAAPAAEQVNGTAGSAVTAFPPVPGFAGSSDAMRWPGFASGTPADPAHEAPSSPPSPAPAGPVSGAGSGAAPSGPLSAAAYVEESGLNHPLRQSFRFDASRAHAPSPVSFDPGSSPD